MKQILSVFIIAAFLLGLTLSGGCSPKEPENTKVSPRDNVIYNVAVSGGFPPFGFIGKDGNPQGFEIDLMNAIAEEEGMRLKYLVTSWASKMPALKSKQVDILLCSMTITEERKQEVDFSDSYFESSNYILVPLDSEILHYKDLKGKTISVLQASTSDCALSDLLGKNYEGIKRFKHTTTAFLELRNRKVDASVGDSGIVMYYVKSNPEAKLKIIKDDKFPKEQYGMAVRKGDTEIVEKINRGLEKIRQNGKYEQIYQKWFETI